MRKKNELTKDEMAEYARYWFEKNFKTQCQAAEYFDVSKPFINHVFNGNQLPNRDMLVAMGYEKETIYRRVK